MEGFSSGQLRLNAADSIPCYRSQITATSKRTTALCQLFQKERCEFRINKAQRAFRFIQHRHLDTQRRERGCVLAGNDASTKYQHGPRQVGHGENGIAVQNVFMINLNVGRISRTRSGGNNHLRSSHDLLITGHASD